MVRFTTGNIFDSKCDCLVNPVNCQGVMGKGLALEFKNRYPEIMQTYKEACGNDTLGIGRVQILKVGDIYIVNFPTKENWHEPSTWMYIRDGLLDLVEKLPLFPIKSVAMPKLGCGLGSLDYRNIKPLIKRIMEDSPVKVVVYE